MDLPRLFSFLVTCVVFPILITCGKDGPTTPTPPTPPTSQPPTPAVPTRITISPSSASLTSIGQTIQLHAAVYDNNNAQIPGAVVTWSSNRPAVATVSATGLVTAVMNGLATITTRSGSASQSAVITVTIPVIPQSITIEPTTATLMAIGETVQLNATVLDQNGQPIEDAVVSWESDNESVSTVDTKGLVTAVGDGSATITARSGNVSVSIPVSVTIEITEPLTDREVLISFYNKTNGPNWTNSENWLSDAPLGTWYGVLANSSGEVTYLQLDDNNLEGDIPRELGQLGELRVLQLRFNRLTGSIPRELAHLSYLTGLVLDDNRLTGVIPPEMGQLSKLESLSVYRNQVSGAIPPELGQLSNLLELWLSNNQFSGTVPVEIGGLKKLQTLGLSRNYGLYGPLPVEILNLTDMKNLLLDFTRICIPPTDAFQSWLGGLLQRLGGAECPDSQRDALIALYNQTDGANWTRRTNWSSYAPLDEWFGVTTDRSGQVTGIDLADNNLNGTIPSQLSKIAGLRSLNLSNNPRLTGTLPIVMANLNLDVLNLAGTGLCASPDSEFQDWLGGIMNAIVDACADPRREFYILASFFHNTNGPGWTNLTNWLSDAPLGTWYGVTTNVDEKVTQLKLIGNNLQGAIPGEIGELEKLEVLNLGDNRLMGPIPPELGKLQDLTILQLDRNKLAGDIPSEIGNLENLEILKFGTNNLSGSIPESLALLENLSALELHRNSLSGPIPPGLGRLENLKWLILFTNKLTGTIPTTFGQLSNLKSLFLTGNRLSGSVPPELGQLRELTELLLPDNSLTGSIPPELGQLQNLEVMFLDSNNLTGPIPPQIGQLRSLIWLSLEHNNLTGPIPPQIGQLGRVEQMKLGDNRLDGTIPPELGRLGSLEQLLLDSNRLTGMIPQEIGRLGNLQELRLSFNQLSGKVPESLGDLSNLKILGLTDNADMSGKLPLTLTNLELDELLLEGTGLCAPEDPGFLAWLRTVPNSRVGNCVAVATESQAYLIQATQSLKHPVPLVAGEDALLRVFVSQDTDADVTMPLVRATFYMDDATVFAIDIPGESVLVPRQIDEGDLSASANATVPGNVLVPGLEMVVEIDPDGETDPSLGIFGRLPATGRTVLDVNELPPVKLTMIPFLWTEEPDHSIVMQVEGLTGDSDLFRYTRDLLPVKDIDLVIHDPVSISVDPSWENREEVFRITTMISTMEGASGLYMGVLRDGGGVARVGENMSISALDEFSIAHEIGHNFNLSHAPCGGAGDPDPDFPQTDGSIGNVGYDYLDEVLVSPDTSDLMTYCHPKWISDYHFSKAMGYRLSQAARSQAAEAAVTSSQRSLLLWGGIDRFGDLILEPAFIIEAIPSISRLDGPYRITGEDTDGRTLFEFSFGMAEIADSEGGSFASVVPMRPDWTDRLDRITFSGPEGVVTLDGRDEPAAVMLMDTTSGAVRGLLRDSPGSDVSMQTAQAVRATPEARTARRVIPEPGLEAILNWSNQGSGN